MEKELIGIREAARRLGVSDTAVHKAIASGRVVIVGRTETSNRPLLAWPQTQTDWEANTDASQRMHVGGDGTSKARAAYAGKGYGKKQGPLLSREQAEQKAAAVVAKLKRVKPAPKAPAVAASEPVDLPAPADEGDDEAEAQAVRSAVVGPTQAQSKAKREYYLALQAKLDYEESIGKMVSSDDVKIKWTKLITAAKTKILGIPANCKARNADLSLKTIAIIEEVCRQALDDLANERD